MKSLSIVFLLVLLAAPASSQTLEQRLQSHLDSVHRAGSFPGATAAVVLPDGRTLELAVGLSDTALRRPMRPADRMMAGSVGKTFFAALALQLVREGRLDLDAKISRWLGSEPWFDSLPNARDVTVRQLMNHSSGIVRYEFNPRFLADLTAAPMRAFTPVEELRYLFGSAAPFAAGQGWDYSDTNYIILAMIAERILGRRAYDEIRRRFLEPRDLRNTVPTDSPDIPGLVQGYAGPGSDFAGLDAVLVNGRFGLNPQFEWAGGGYASTSSDLARWLKGWYEGLDADTALKRQVLDGVPAPMLGREGRYGLGVIIRPTPLGISWGHSGFFPGYLTEVRYYPDLRIAVAVQMNSSRARGIGAIANGLATIARGN